MTPRRGAVVIVATPGDFGKPRPGLPGLIVQSDLFAEHPSVTLCLLTSHLRDTPLFRLTVEPSAENGLRQTSQIQIDKMVTVRREKIAQAIGRLNDSTMIEVDRALALWIRIA